MIERLFYRWPLECRVLYTGGSGFIINFKFSELYPKIASYDKAIEIDPADARALQHLITED